MILGVASIVFPLTVKSQTIRKEIPFVFLPSIVLLLLISDITLENTQINIISRSEGLVLLFFFAIFRYYVFEVARNDREERTQDPPDSVKTSRSKDLAMTMGRIAGIILGGRLVVDNSIQIALSLGMSEH